MHLLLRTSPICKRKSSVCKLRDTICKLSADLRFGHPRPIGLIHAYTCNFSPFTPLTTPTCYDRVCKPYVV